MKTAHIAFGGLQPNIEIKTTALNLSQLHVFYTDIYSYKYSYSTHRIASSTIITCAQDQLPYQNYKQALGEEKQSRTGKV